MVSFETNTSCMYTEFQNISEIVHQMYLRSIPFLFEAISSDLVKYFFKQNLIFNPLSRSVKIQILLTGIHMFSSGTNYENL